MTVALHSSILVLLLTKLPNFSPLVLAYLLSGDLVHDWNVFLWPKTYKFISGVPTYFS